MATSGTLTTWYNGQPIITETTSGSLTIWYNGMPYSYLEKSGGAVDLTHVAKTADYTITAGDANGTNIFSNLGDNCIIQRGTLFSKHLIPPISFSTSCLKRLNNSLL